MAKKIIYILITVGLMIGCLLIGKTLMNSDKKVLDIQHWTTQKGVPVYFVESPNLPMFDIQVSFDAGSARDGQQNGLAYLTNTLLSEGTQALDADAVAERFEAVGAEFELSSHCDIALVGIRSLNKPEIIKPVLDTFVEVLSKPAFLDVGFKREQAQLLMGLKYETQRPDKLAQKAFYTKLYSGHPYGNWESGKEETVKKLTPEDLKAFHKRYYVAKNAVISIVGALTLNQAKEMAEQISNALETGEHAPVLPPLPKPVYSAPEKITFPSEQTHIMMGQTGMKRGDPDFFSLVVGNHILGGNGTVTRIFTEIRHKRGLAYDAHSYFIPMREKGPFIMGLQTQTAQAADALKILESTVKDFIAKGPTSQEVEEAKLNLLGGYPLLFDNNKSIVSNLTMLGFYNLPLDYFDTYKKNVENISQSSIQDAFKRRLDPNNMAVVMVGR